MVIFPIGKNFHVNTKSPIFLIGLFLLITTRNIMVLYSNRFHKPLAIIIASLNVIFSMHSFLTDELAQPTPDIHQLILVMLLYLHRANV